MVLKQKKDGFKHFPPISSILHHSFTSQPRIEPGCGGLVAEHDYHYTAQLATMQWQNVVFKPNVWEKGNGTCVSVCMTSFYLPHRQIRNFKQLGNPDQQRSHAWIFGTFWRVFFLIFYSIVWQVIGGTSNWQCHEHMIVKGCVELLDDKKLGNFITEIIEKDGK